MSNPIRTQQAFADGDGGIIIETKQDITDILEANKAQREFDKQRTGHLNELHHVARIPYTVIDDLNQKGIMRGFAVVDQERFAQFLNGTELGNALKTYRGTI
jgi:hypothetical protein